jgi:hypothetical protein
VCTASLQGEVHQNDIVSCGPLGVDSWHRISTASFDAPVLTICGGLQREIEMAGAMHQTTKVLFRETGCTRQDEVPN